MSRDKTLVIKVDGDTTALQREFKKIKDQTKNLEKGLSTVAKTSAVAFTGLTAAIVGVTKAFRDDEQAQIRTVQTLKATGNAAGVTAEEMFTLAESLQDVTTFSDSTVLEGQNLLLTFRNIGGDVLPRVTEAMLDMSTAMKVGVKESAIQLGKALNDPIAGISALTRVGITFSDEQKATIKALDEVGDRAGAQVIILKELEMQFGGVSRAAAQGTGKIIQLSNIFSNLASQVGETVVVVLEPFVDKLIEIGKELRDGDSAFAKITGKVLVYGSAITAAITGLALFGLAMVQIRKGLLLTRVAFIALTTAAKGATAAMTFGLSLVVTLAAELIDRFIGLENVATHLRVTFEAFVESVIIGANNVRIGLNTLLITMKEVGAAAQEALPGKFFAKNAADIRKNIEQLKLDNQKLIESNKDLRRSFGEIYDDIDAERAAEKVREEENAVREARAAAAIEEANRVAAEELLKREKEKGQRDIVAEQKAAAFETDLAVREAENKLFQAQTDKASNVEITKLKQKLAALKKQRDESIDNEQKAAFKNQEELRKAAEEDAKKTLELKEKSRDDILSLTSNLNSDLVKKGTLLHKTLFAIEKASAFASNIINTAKAVTLALASAPPPLNFALAAAVGAAGAVQAAAIAGSALGLENGGLVGPMGAGRSGDRHPAMLADGELVVPRRNFEEVVSAFAKQRGFVESGQEGNGGATKIEIGFTDEAAEFITAQQFENTTLGTDRG